MRTSIAIIILLVIAGFASAQTIPSGYQDYFVVGSEQHVMDYFSTVAATEGQGCSSTLPTSMASVVSVAASTDNQIVYYDQWEDGLEANLLSPVQATTLVLGDGNPANGNADNFTNDPRVTSDVIYRGTVLTFNSDKGSGTIENQFVPIPRVATDIRYDGGDRLESSGGPLTLIHSQHPANCNYIGSSLEILSRQAVGNALSYSVPVGTNTYTRYGGENTPGEPFKYVFIDLIAFDDGTSVFIDNKSGGTASFTLNRGQHYSSQGKIDTSAAPAVQILEGTKINTNKPIGGMVYTAGSGTYQDRPFALLPDLMHSTDFVVPAPGDDAAVNGSRPLNLYIYNPDPVSTINVTGTDSTGSATFTVGPNSVRAYSEAGAMNRFVPANSGARLASNSNFWGFAAYDHQDTTVDWGHSWLATRFLTSVYSVSWSPGTADPAGSFASRPASCSTPPGGCDSANRSPLFITAIQNNTRIQIDLNNDGVYDVVDTNSNDISDAAPLPNNTYTLNALQTLRVYDNTDYDNTGTQIVANKPVVVSYGQDTEQGVPGDVSLDLGHMVYPLDQRWLDPVFTIDKTSNTTYVPLTGGPVTYTLTVKTYVFGPITNITVSDLMPAGGTYSGGSSFVTYPGGGPVALAPNIAGQQLSWPLSPNTMNANETLTITYTVNYAASASPRTLRNTAKASGQLGGSTFSPLASEDVTQTAVQITTTSTPSIVGVGQVLTYTTTITNSGTAETGVSVIDDIPYPVTFLGSITSSNPAFTGAFNFAQNSVVFSAATFAAGATATFSYQVTVNSDVMGGLVITNNSVYESNETSNLTATASSVVASPVLTYVKAGPTVASPGDTITYTVTATNTGASASNATSFAINDPIPANTTYAANSMSYQLNGGSFVTLTDANDGDAGTKLASSVRLSLASLLVGDTVTFRFSVTVNAVTPPATANNVAAVSSTQSGTDDTNLVSTGIQIIGATLSGPSSAAPGDTLFYTLILTNTSPTTATNLVVSDFIPANTTYVAESMDYRINSGVFIALTDNTANDDPGYKLANSVELRLASVAPGASVTFRFRVTATPASTPIYVNNVATYTATQFASTSTNTVQTYLQSAAQITPAPVVNSPIFQGDSSISGTSSSPNGTVIRVFRNGVYIGQTTVTGGTWTLSGVSGLMLGDQITADATEFGKSTSNLSPPVIVGAISQQTPPPFVLGPYYQGENIIRGTSSSPDGTIINVYVNGVFVGQTTVNGGVWAVKGVNPALVTGETIRATAQEPGKGTSTFSNTETVLPPPTISKHSSANGFDVIPGQTLTYTVTMANTTAATWTNLNVSDPLPAGTNYVAASSSVTTPQNVTINDTYRDEFTANNVYTGSNGTLNWASNAWCETGDGAGCGSSTGGNIFLTTDGVFSGVNKLRIAGATRSIQRVANLSTYTSATLTFSYRRSGLDNGTDTISVQASSNGGSTWTNLQTYAGPATDGAYTNASFDITAYISTNTAIRFVTSGTLGNSDILFVDDVQIAISRTVRQTVTSGACAPPTLIGAAGCNGFTLQPGETMVVTYKVTLQDPMPVGQTSVVNTATFSSDQVSSTSSTVTDYINGYPDVLRNDQTTSLASYNPSAIFVHMYPVRPAMDQWGADYWPQEGEGALQQGNGSSDDDDFYKLAIPNTWLDPDTTVLSDNTRPLVFYEVTCNGCTILLTKDPSGKIKISY